jgi:ribose transport system ATP-binding protein
MNILGGVLRPDGGRLRLGGQDYAPSSPMDAARQGVAFIHQELNLFSNLSVAENIFLTGFPKRFGAVDRKRLRARTVELLRAVELDVAPDTLVETLSPGERQLVEIAKALSVDARVVIFDEPTTSLTARETERLFALIEKLRGEGRSMIYISHALQDVMRVCDDILVLRDGESVAFGPKTDFTIERMIALMVGRDLAQLFPARETHPRPEPLLEVKGISQPGIVEDITFTLRRGEVLGVAGLMGSGRTELARILFGLDPHARGIIELDGKPLSPEPRTCIQRGLAFLTESRREEGLLMDAPIIENVGLASLPGHAGKGLGLLDGKRLGDAVTGVCREVRIADAKLRGGAVKTLSGGNQQKVVLAKWLLTKPSVFILDEPTRGIDVGAKHEIYRLINELVATGAGVLLISSELEELIGMCDRIMVMCRGEIAGTLDRAAFDREAILRYALGGGGGQPS